MLVVFRLTYTRGSGGGSMHLFSALPIAAVVIIAFGQASEAADIPVKAPRPETVTGAHADIQTVWARLNVRLAPLIRSY